MKDIAAPYSVTASDAGERQLPKWEHRSYPSALVAEITDSLQHHNPIPIGFRNDSISGIVSPTP